ncbi:hypothetical protein PMI04_013965 [Sphingobium sp. AP49]|uniref:hypothetical protein n=1 Tax=Sphingobium sp. AP49 TaxID=1144307 RepID=UPI00026EE119|nr:hypothetical protein [Sphingobium sp. AP49]WHO37668.1 hypothetical protein PMI04_013965 [Sphingobium sp. AP49]
MSMSWTRRWKDRFVRLQVAARQEFLRDPAIILFERAGDSGASVRDAAGGR